MAAAYNRRDAPKEWNLKHVAEGIFSFDDDFLETKPRNHEGEWIMVSILAFTVSLPWLIDDGIISRCEMILLQRSLNIDALSSRYNSKMAAISIFSCCCYLKLK